MPSRSLASWLYTDANSDIDKHYRNVMREQDKAPEATDTGKPRFTLVVGPSPFSMPRGWEFFLTSPYEGATYISTVMHNAGYPVRIIDVRYSVDPRGEALRGILEGTDVLGICTFEDNFPFVRELMQDVKRAAPDMPIICGGSLVTSVPHIFMDHTDCDVAVISEGEITILQVMELYSAGAWGLDDTTALKDVRGIWYRDNEGKSVFTPPRGQLMDLDCLPKMRLDLWPQYHSEQGLQPQIISSYSRGCKMDCSFCYRTTPMERAKSPEKLDEELAWLKSQYGTEFIFFVDLTFTSHKKQTLGILDAIKPHDIRWTCLTRCADVDEERLTAMKDAGADIVLYGVESLGKDILKEARKGNTENITLRAQRRTYEAGLRFGGLLIVGLPGETEESMEHMCQWQEENRDLTRVKYLSAMPGTTVYRQGLKEGYLKGEIEHLNWLSIEQALHQDEFINYNGLPEAKLRECYKRLYDCYTPGPVMDFQHWPEHFTYHDPNPHEGNQRAVDYANEYNCPDQWRGGFASASPYMIPGSERFTLKKIGAPESQVLGGASASWAEAKRLSCMTAANAKVEVAQAK